MTDNINDVMERLEQDAKAFADGQGSYFTEVAYREHADDLKALLSYTKQCREAARQETVNEIADLFASLPLTPAKKELAKAALRAAISSMNARQTLSTQPGER